MVCVFDAVIINDIDLDFCLALLLQHAESTHFHVLSQCYIGVGLGILAFAFVVALVLACALGLCSHVLGGFEHLFFETFKQIHS
jgi:hypothetical protein